MGSFPILQNSPSFVYASGLVKNCVLGITHMGMEKSQRHLENFKHRTPFKSFSLHVQKVVGLCSVDPHKKVSRAYILKHTGSPPFWIEFVIFIFYIFLLDFYGLKTSYRNKLLPVCPLVATGSDLL